MRFIVTYRNLQGNSQEIQIDASSREQCLNTLHGKNIVPIQIKESTNQHNFFSGIKLSQKNIIFVSATIIIVTSLICFYLRSKGDTNKNEGKITVNKISHPKKLSSSIKKSSFPTAKTIMDHKNKQPTGILKSISVDQKSSKGGNDVVKKEEYIPEKPQKAPPVFRHFSERHIAGLLKIQPGETLIGTLNYGKAFLRDFKNSLTNDIVILDTDDPETQELKRIVAETKEDLRERMERGEDICEIMSETRKELQQMGLYRFELKSEFQKMYHDREVSDKEVDEFFQFANDRLREKGLKPIKLPHIFLKKFKELKGQ